MSHNHNAFSITLIIKGSEDEAISEVVKRLNEWFLEDVKNPAPYSPKSLLHWSIRAINGRDYDPDA